MPPPDLPSHNEHGATWGQGKDPTNQRGGGGGEEVQKCTGQKCTKHQLVLLTILNVVGPKKVNNS